MEEYMERNNTEYLGIGLITGLAIGLALGLLYAPKTGVETRAMLRQRAEEMRDRAEEMAEDVKMKAGDVAQKARESLKKMRGTEGEAA